MCPGGAFRSSRGRVCTPASQDTLLPAKEAVSAKKRVFATQNCVEVPAGLCLGCVLTPGLAVGILHKGFGHRDQAAVRVGTHTCVLQESHFWPRVCFRFLLKRGGAAGEEEWSSQAGSAGRRPRCQAPAALSAAAPEAAAHKARPRELPTGTELLQEPPSCPGTGTRVARGGL